MPTYADFDGKYESGRNPWDARLDEPYYQRLLGMVATHAPQARTVLDVGCGEGHVTAVLGVARGRCIGLDISPAAIQRARMEHPELEFVVADIRDLAKIGLPTGFFELIVCSQVLYYLTWEEATRAMETLEQLLSPSGILVAAANCSGGPYFQPDEFTGMVSETLQIEACESVDHHVFVAARRRVAKVALTVDYEVLEHRTMLPSEDVWRAEVLEPCRRLLDLCDANQVRITLFFEVCQYWFLERFMPRVSRLIAEQLQLAAARGHDVQLHMHTRWVPWFGASIDPATGRIVLAEEKSRLQDLAAEELRNTLRQGRDALEALISPIRPGYRPTVFRAGKYQIQPHADVFAALTELGFKADSSVWQGGFLSTYDKSPGFDFRSLKHPWRTYYPGTDDVCQEAATVAERAGLVEIPILAPGGAQLSIDHGTAQDIIRVLHEWSSGGGPRVIIGHTKLLGDTQYQALKSVLTSGNDLPLVQFATMEEVASDAVAHHVAARAERVRVEYLRRSYEAPESLWRRLTPYNQRKVALIASELMRTAPHDGDMNVLDVGCGTGELLTLPLRHLLDQDPRGARVMLLGVDIDRASIARAKEISEVYSVEGVNFEAVPIDDCGGSFDWVVCSEVLEHLVDPLPLMRAIRTAVRSDGSVILTTPNGFGYQEIERRLLYAGLATAQRAPLMVRERLRAVARRLRARVKARNYAASKTPVFGTLNFANDIHVQFFTRRAIASMAHQAGLAVEETWAVQTIGGIGGAILESSLGLGNDIVEKWPLGLAASWVFRCRPI